MPTRPVTRYDDDLSFTPDFFSLLPTSADTDSLDMPDCDTAWGFETDADPAQQMQIQFSDFGSADIDMDLQPLSPSDSHIPADAHAHADVVHVAGDHYQTTSNRFSFSVPASSRLTSVSSASFPWSSSVSPSPRFPIAAVEAPQPPHRNIPQVQVDPCTSQRCRSETCLTAALRILTTLHIAHSACLSAHREAPTVPQARKMETVLSTNRDVVAGMRPMLTCSCSAKSLVQLLLLSICGNLIAWNSALISADLEQQGIDNNPLSSAATQAPRARVLPQPITIGQHQINGKLGRALHAQVMAGELRVLEGLINALSNRFSEASRQSMSDSGASTSGTSPGASTHMRNNGNGRDTTPLLQSKGLPSNVHRQIISWLRARLQRTRAKIFSMG